MSRYVYFIRAGESGPIKIGRATCPRNRLSSMQSGTLEDLSIIALMDGDAELEREYHKKFADHRIRGEWFEPHEDILAEAAKHPPTPRYWWNS